VRSEESVVLMHERVRHYPRFGITKHALSGKALRNLETSNI